MDSKNTKEMSNFGINFKIKDISGLQELIKSLKPNLNWQNDLNNYYNNEFNFEHHRNNCKAISYKEDTFCILILGYDSINNFLNNNEESVKLDDIILKSKEINNFKFILYDTVDEIQTIEQTEYDGYFKRKNGLWLGKEFENQTLFETNSIYSDATLNNTVTIVYNGEVQNIKYN